jgi:hypothetical protein
MPNTDPHLPTIDESIIDAATNSLMLVSMSTTSMSFSLSDKEAKQRLADLDGVDRRAYKTVTKTLLPPGYDDELKAAQATVSAARQQFYATTMPFSQQASGAAAEKRAVTVEQLTQQPSWLATMALLGRDIKAAADTLANALPRLMTDIAADPLYAAGFRPELYPSPDDVRNGFKFKLHGPEPIGRFDYLPITGEMARYLSERHERQVRKAIEFGQQQIGRDLLRSTQTIAQNLSSLVDFADGKTDRKKAPRIFDSLTENLRANITKLRTFAMPDTPEGAALLAMADKAEQALVPEGRTADDFKASVPLARATASAAAELAADIESLDVMY